MCLGGSRAHKATAVAVAVAVAAVAVHSETKAYTKRLKTRSPSCWYVPAKKIFKKLGLKIRPENRVKNMVKN